MISVRCAPKCHPQNHKGVTTHCLPLKVGRVAGDAHNGIVKRFKLLFLRSRVPKELSSQKKKGLGRKGGEIEFTKGEQ